MCLKPIIKSGFYSNFELCSNCCDILKKPFRDMASIELRLVSLFLAFWSSRKLIQEEIDERKKIRIQRKMEEKLHVKNL